MFYMLFIICFILCSSMFVFFSEYVDKVVMSKFFYDRIKPNQEETKM